MTDSELVAATFQRLVENVDDIGASNLSSSERVVCRVVWLIAAVDNGGFPSFFYNSEADCLAETIEALLRIGAADIAQLLRRAVALFPQPLGKTLEERNAQWDELPSNADEVFSALDNEFYALEPILEARLAKFIREQPGLGA